MKKSMSPGGRCVSMPVVKSSSFFGSFAAAIPVVTAMSAAPSSRERSKRNTVLVAIEYPFPERKAGMTCGGHEAGRPFDGFGRDEPYRGLISCDLLPRRPEGGQLGAPTQERGLLDSP